MGGDDSPGGFELERFEHVAVGGGLALLRIAGTWREPSGGADLSDTTMLVRAGTRDVLVLLPLPDPGPPRDSRDGRPRPWRAAFGLPAQAPGQRVHFSLRVASGPEIELPPPERRSLEPPARQPVSDPEGLRASAQRGLAAAHLVELQLTHIKRAIETTTEGRGAAAAAKRAEIQRRQVELDGLEKRIARVRDELGADRGLT